MQTADLIILGAVMQKPRSAYEVQKDAMEHDYPKWTKVSTPSIYRRILRLCEEGYLESKMVPGAGRGEKAVYSATEAGRRLFEGLMHESATSPANLQFDFNALIANLNRLATEEQTELLSTLEGNLRSQLETVREESKKHAHLPVRARTIFDQQERMLEALLEWLAGFREAYAPESAENGQEEAE